MTKPKILIYDIETSPNLGYIWGKYQQDVIQFERDWYMLSFAYKWLGDKKTYVKALPDYKRYKKEPFNDVDLIKDLYLLMDECDMIIAHNGDRFDQKKSNTRILLNDIPPPSHYHSIDTLKVAKKYFAFTSNRLNDLGVSLGVGQKEKTDGFQTWYGCLMGNQKDWNKMKKYNKQDVILLERVYEKLRPWIENHPNLALYKEGSERVCPKCGEEALTQSGTRTTRTGVYKRYLCVACGGWSKGRVMEKKEAKPLAV